MERTYKYDPHFYRIKVLYMHYAIIGILGYCLYYLIANWLNPLFIIAAVICIYALKNLFLSKSVPRYVIVDDDNITFKSFGEKTLRVKSLKLFRVKTSTPGYQVVIRAADEEGNRGTFWVSFNYFNDKQDLLEEFNYLERKTHPDSIRLRGGGLGKSRPSEKTEEPALDEASDEIAKTTSDEASSESETE